MLEIRKRRKHRVGLSLVPVGHRKEIVGTVIGVAVLDSRAQRFRERYRGIQVKPVNRRSAAGALRAADWRAE